MKTSAESSANGKAEKAQEEASHRETGDEVDQALGAHYCKDL